MVAFRKIFPVLAIVALLLGTALTANAQAVVAPTSAPVCTANAGVPPIVRSEGLTELMGDLVLICQGGRAGQTFLVNFQIFLNTNITSRIVGSTPGTFNTTSIFGTALSSGGGDVTEALLLIDEPGAADRATPFCVSPSPGNNSTGPFTGTNSTPTTAAGASCNSATAAPAGSTFQTGTYTVFRGQRAVGTQNALIWAGIPVVAPGTAGVQRVFRFTNIRANASMVGVSDTLIPSQIVAYVAVNPPGSLSIDNPQQVVGFVQRGLRFDTTDCAGDGLGSRGVQFPQCGSFQSGRLPGNSVQSVGLLRFRENFPAAFKVRIHPDQAQGTMAPGTVFLASESGFVRAEAGLENVGVATNGTRLAVRFNNIPAGIRVWVGTRGIFGSAQAFLVSAGTSGENVTLNPGRFFNNPQQLAGTGSGNLQCGDAGVPAYELTVVGGSATAIYEVIQTFATSGTTPEGGTANLVPNAPRGDVIDDIRIPFSIAYSSNLSGATPSPALGTATVTGSFAPFYAASNTSAGQASSTLPIPRFVDQGINSTIFRINQCVTNLLFPYVTNWAGFDTGIAISNTSADPFEDPSSRAQSGNCTINYYGRLQNGNAPTTTRENTDRVVGPGEHLTFILSGGGTNGLKGNPGFQGYIIAQCGFQYAHGFAFITDGPIGAARVAEGYLAVVLDNPFYTDSIGRSGTQGENMAH